MTVEEQPRLPMDLPEPVRSRRRRRLRPRGTRSRRGEKTLTLLQTPIMERCALCGSRQTIRGDAAICDRCGALIFRRDDDDE